MTPVHLLGFQKPHTISPHFGGVFTVSMSNGGIIDVIFINITPLMLLLNGFPTLLQGSH